MVLDLYARRVVGWAMSSSPDADLVVKALDHAWQLLGQCTDGKAIPEPEIGMDTGPGLPKSA